MRIIYRIALAFMVVLASVAFLCADERESAKKLLERTMFNPEFHPKSFHGGEWYGNGDAYLALEPSASGKDTDIVRYQTATGARDVLISANRLIPQGEAKALEIEDYRFSSDGQQLLIFTNTQAVWRQHTRGDYWILNLKSDALRKLGGDATPSTLMFAKFSPDNSKVAYVRGNNIYAEEIASSKIVQLTHDGSSTIINGTSDWVDEEEFDIRDGFQWSPDGHAIAYWQFNTEGVQNFTLIYNLGNPRGKIVTQIPYPQTGVYPETLVYPYPEAGTRNSAVRVGVVSLKSGKTAWMNTSGDPHDFYIPRMEWADAKHLLLQHMNRLQNKNEFLLADGESGSTRTIFVDEDRAWVELNDEILWLNQHREFLVLSERDGWRHLYRVERDTGKSKLVTHSDFDVVKLERVTPDEQFIYFTASPDNPTQRYLYRVRLDGSGAAERITPIQPGTHSYTIAPNGEYAFHNFSAIDEPPHSDVVHLPDHRVLRTTADNAALAEHVKPLSGGAAEFLKLDAGNGLMVDGWLVKPPNFDANKKYPLIVEVYSEPAGQTTEDRWQSMFVRALTAAGYLVATFDNQGTPAPRGREWRKVVYKNIGPLSSQEQCTALQSLEKAHAFVDAKRVGVWGWSGGGTETLNLMFRYPDVYAVGVAVASVPDQRLYDSIYQERYMGLPQDDPKAWEQSSAINFSSGLRGDLLVMHGSGDDNVHYQGFELLVNNLIAQGKVFDMRVYPGRTHGIFEGSGTTPDVFTNILGYFETHLPPEAK
ncbi:MAG TPA: S9 family peptidase [Verrucomicrobiae bacterium]|nr:S9 family peptidase [Verrucomicrobiae bacterium]